MRRGAAVAVLLAIAPRPYAAEAPPAWAAKATRTDDDVAPTITYSPTPYPTPVVLYHNFDSLDDNGATEDRDAIDVTKYPTPPPVDVSKLSPVQAELYRLKQQLNTPTPPPTPPPPTGSPTHAPTSFPSPAPTPRPTPQRSCPAGRHAQREDDTYKRFVGHGLKAIICDDCPAGKFRAAGAEALGGCHACEAGRFGRVPRLALPSCSGTCQPGRFSGVGATSCESCAPGWYSSRRASTKCTKCAPGTDTQGAPWTGAVHCTASATAAAGSSSSRARATAVPATTTTTTTTAAPLPGLRAVAYVPQPAAAAFKPSVDIIRVTVYATRIAPAKFSPLVVDRFQKALALALGVEPTRCRVTKAEPVQRLSREQWVVSTWSTWGQCTRECAEGFRLRTRVMLAVAEHDDSAPQVVEKGFCQRDCPPCDASLNRDCAVSDWGAWAVCSGECGSGTSARWRQVTTPTRCSGNPCPLLMETRFCTPKLCPGAVVTLGDGEDLPATLIGTRVHVSVVLPVQNAHGKTGDDVVRTLNSASFTKYLSRALRDNHIEIGGHRLAVSAISVYHPASSYLTALASIEKQAARGASDAGPSSMVVDMKSLLAVALLLAGASYLSRQCIDFIAFRYGECDDEEATHDIEVQQMKGARDPGEEVRPLTQSRDGYGSPKAQSPKKSMRKRSLGLDSPSSSGSPRSLQSRSSLT